MSPRFWRIAWMGGVLSLFVVYLVWWGRMISTPAERSSVDFIALYAAGRVAQTHGLSSVYDIKSQQQIEQEVVGFRLADKQVLLYNHMPYLVPLLALVVNEDYVGSFVRWALILTGVYLAGSVYLVKSLFADQNQTVRITLVSAVLTFFPLFISVWQGQDTAFLYLGVALWYVGILKRQEWLVAIGLTLATIRPHVSIALSIPLLFGHMRAWWRFALTAGGLAGLSLLILGLQGTAQFVNLLVISSEGDWFGMNPASMLNLLGFVMRTVRFLDPAALSLIGWIIFLIGLVVIGILWKRSEVTGERLLGLTVLITALTAPRLHLHDLMLLIFPLLFLAKLGISTFSQRQWALLPLGASFILLFGILWHPLRFILPYVLFILIAWLLWHSNRWKPSIQKLQRYEQNVADPGSNESYGDCHR